MLTRISRISRILVRCIPPSIALSLFLASHRSHGFAQISSLQATGILILPLCKKSEGVGISVRSVGSVWENSTFLTLLSRILSRTFRNSPCSRLPSGRDRRDRTCDTPLPCCQDSPLSASPGLWCSDASSAKNEADSRTGYDWHNPLRHA